MILQHKKEFVKNALKICKYHTCGFRMMFSSQNHAVSYAISQVQFCLTFTFRYLSIRTEKAAKDFVSLILHGTPISWLKLS